MDELEESSDPSLVSESKSLNWRRLRSPPSLKSRSIDRNNKRNAGARVTPIFDSPKDPRGSKIFPSMLKEPSNPVFSLGFPPSMGMFSPMDLKEPTIEDIHIAQKQKQVEYVNGMKLCTGKFKKAYPRDIRAANLLKETLTNQFYNSRHFEDMLCNFNGAFELAKPYGLKTDSIVSDISKLARMGAPSVEGRVWKTVFKGVENLFIIKTPRIIDNDMDPDVRLYHEWFVGVSCLNRLRERCSNFMFVYGTFECNMPVEVLFEGRPLLTYFCNSSKARSVTYLAIENIPNSLSLEDAIPDASDVDILIWTIQICSALKLAYDECGFCHYDLHAGNVLLRDVGKPVYVEIPGFGHILTSKIPVIIDYGRCRVSVNGENYGYYGLTDYFVDPNVAKPEVDLYKLLGFMFYAFDGYNDRDAGRPYDLFLMIKFFDKKVPDDRFVLGNFLAKERETFFNIARDTELTLDERSALYPAYIKYLLYHFKFLLKSSFVPAGTKLPKGSKKWDCMGGVCIPSE